MSRRDWSATLLASGAALGAIIAALGILGGRWAGPPTVPDDAVAVVNGSVILESDYQRALRTVAADLRAGSVDPTMRRRVLERLIEQELLVQRGLELELAERDPRIRATLSDAVIGLLVARGDTPAEPPDESALRAFFEQHQGYFRTPGRVRLDHIWFGERSSGGADRAHRRATQAHRRLAGGEEFAVVAKAGDVPPAPPPNDWLPLGKVRDYLGPAAARAVAELDDDEPSSPLRLAGGYAIVRVVDRRAGWVPPFDQVRQQVAAEHRRQSGDRALRGFLEDRRRTAAIAIAEERL